MGKFILSMLCVSGDEVQVAIHRIQDITRWLKTLDHEGATWSVVHHVWDEVNEKVLETNDITDMIEREYRNV